MNKPFVVALTLGIVGVAYLLLAVMMPAITEISAVASTSMNASANMSNQPGVMEATQSAPYWLWAVPGSCGIIFIAIILRRGERS